MVKVTWEGALVGSLCESKAAGYSFVAAWKLALLQNPPRSAVEREIVGAVEEFAWDASHGQRPALRHFSLEMLREGDGARSAAHPGQSRAMDAAVAA